MNFPNCTEAASSTESGIGVSLGLLYCTAKHTDLKKYAYLSSIVLTNDIKKNSETMTQNFGFLKATKG